MPNITNKLDFGKDNSHFQQLAALKCSNVVKTVRNVNVIMWKLVLKLSLTEESFLLASLCFVRLFAASHFNFSLKLNVKCTGTEDNKIYVYDSLL